MAYSNRDTINFPSPSSSYMDGIRVKISEKYKPPPRINLAMSYSQRLSLNKQIQDSILQPRYEYTLEKTVKEKMQEWREARSAMQSEFRNRLDEAKRLHKERLLEKQKQMEEENQRLQQQMEEEQKKVIEQQSLTVSNSTTNPNIPDKSQLATCSTTESSEISTNNNNNNNNTSDYNSMLIPTQVPQQQQLNTILTPIPLKQQQQHCKMPSLNLTGESFAVATTTAEQKSPFNISDFEADTSSPFDNMALKSINDMEELRQVLTINKNHVACDNNRTSHDNFAPGHTDGGTGYGYGQQNYNTGQNFQMAGPHQQHYSVGSSSSSYGQQQSNIPMSNSYIAQQPQPSMYSSADVVYTNGCCSSAASSSQNPQIYEYTSRPQQNEVSNVLTQYGNVGGGQVRSYPSPNQLNDPNEQSSALRQYGGGSVSNATGTGVSYPSPDQLHNQSEQSSIMRQYGGGGLTSNASRLSYPSPNQISNSQIPATFSTTTTMTATVEHPNEQSSVLRQYGGSSVSDASQMSYPSPLHRQNQDQPSGALRQYASNTTGIITGGVSYPSPHQVYNQTEQSRVLRQFGNSYSGVGVSYSSPNHLVNPVVSATKIDVPSSLRSKTNSDYSMYSTSVPDILRTLNAKLDSTHLTTDFSRTSDVIKSGHLNSNLPPFSSAGFSDDLAPKTSVQVSRTAGADQTRTLAKIQQQFHQHQPRKNETSLASTVDKETDEIFRNLPKNMQDTSRSISSMGFPLSRVARVCKLLGNDQKKILDHLLVMSDLLDLGFPETTVSEALLKTDNDRDRALDILTS